MGNCNTRMCETETLMALLELMAHLEKKKELKKEVIKKVKHEANNWLKDDGNFVNNDYAKGFLPNTVSKANALRNDILKNPKNDHAYSELLKDYNNDTYAELIIDNIFSLFACLYYMYFECGWDSDYIGGGMWQREKVDGSAGETNLNIWLKDQNTEHEIGDKGVIIPRAYTGLDLSEKLGMVLFGKMSSNNLLFFIYGGQLQYAVYYMLFLPKEWKRGMTAHALLFVRAFCEKLRQDEFYANYYDAPTLKTECHQITEKIDKLIRSYAITPVCFDRSVKYENLLLPGRFHMYICWLQSRFTSIITSLNEMKGDIDNWTDDKMKNAEAYGPFPWGFVFRVYWNQDKLDVLRTELGDVISALSTIEKTLCGLAYIGLRTQGP